MNRRWNLGGRIAPQWERWGRTSRSWPAHDQRSRLPPPPSPSPPHHPQSRGAVAVVVAPPASRAHLARWTPRRAPPSLRPVPLLAVPAPPPQQPTCLSEEGAHRARPRPAARTAAAAPPAHRSGQRRMRGRRRRRRCFRRRMRGRRRRRRCFRRRTRRWKCGRRHRSRLGHGQRLDTLRPWPSARRRSCRGASGLVLQTERLLLPAQPPPPPPWTTTATPRRLSEQCSPAHVAREGMWPAAAA
jgi:hypothetical protein